ncbi:MAG: hypothetical protein HQK64_04495 [Desulfamplus sp.]|nr:hypothetical protein [Desulfamplus sp.]
MKLNSKITNGDKIAMLNLLILENNLNLRLAFKKILQQKVSGLYITESHSFIDANKKLMASPPDLILTNTHIAKSSALSFIDNILKDYPHTHIMLLSEYNSFDCKQLQKSIRQKGGLIFSNRLNIEQIISRVNLLKSSIKRSKSSKVGQIESKKYLVTPVEAGGQQNRERKKCIFCSIHTYIHTNKFNV